MKALLAGFAAIVVLGTLAHYALNGAGFSSQKKFSGDAVRLDVTH